MSRPVLALAATLLCLTACSGEPRGRVTGTPEEMSCREEARREVRQQMLADHQELDRPGISGPGVSGSMRAVMGEQERSRTATAYSDCISARRDSRK